MKKLEYSNYFVSGVLLAFIILLAGGGIYKNYSPIPFGDSWDGLVLFISDFNSSSFSEKMFALVDQHNEHRFFFTKILFLLDYHIFSSSFFLLYAFNAAIPVLGIIVIYKAMDGVESGPRLLTVFIAGALAFSLAQHENFLWEFQSQFFLAFYAPLLFYFIFLRFCTGGTLMAFLSILVLSVLSSFTMANGVFFAIPLLVFFALFPATRSWAAFALVGLCLTLLIYLVLLPYQSNPGHGSFQKDVLPDPLRYFEYVLTYMGGPAGAKAAPFVGFAFLSATVFLLVRAFLEKQPERLKNALLLFLLFYCCTVFVTGIGRVNFGVGQALAIRYTTPTLLAWACVIALLVHTFADRKSVRVGLAVITPLFLVAMAVLQNGYYNWISEGNPNREAARLALVMGANDPEVLQRVYPSAEAVQQGFATGKDLGMHFAQPREAWTLIGTPSVSERACNGNVTEIKQIGDSHIRISGVISDPASPTGEPSFDPVYAAGGVIAGVGVRGWQAHLPRRDAFVIYVERDRFDPLGHVHSQPGTDPCFMPVQSAG